MKLKTVRIAGGKKMRGTRLGKMTRYFVALSWSAAVYAMSSSAQTPKPTPLPTPDLPSPQRSAVFGNEIWTIGTRSYLNVYRGRALPPQVAGGAISALKLDNQNSFIAGNSTPRPDGSGIVSAANRNTRIEIFEDQTFPTEPLLLARNEKMVGFYFKRFPNASPVGNSVPVQGAAIRSFTLKEPGEDAKKVIDTKRLFYIIPRDISKGENDGNAHSLDGDLLPSGKILIASSSGVWMPFNPQLDRLSQPAVGTVFPSAPPTIQLSVWQDGSGFSPEVFAQTSDEKIALPVGFNAKAWNSNIDIAVSRAAVVTNAQFPLVLWIALRESRVLDNDLWIGTLRLDENGAFASTTPTWTRAPKWFPLLRDARLRVEPSGNVALDCVYPSKISVAADGARQFTSSLKRINIAGTPERPSFLLPLQSQIDNIVTGFAPEELYSPDNTVRWWFTPTGSYGNFSVQTEILPRTLPGLNRRTGN